MKCSRCGFENPAEFGFCGKCGHALAQVCARCGFQNPPGFAFCGKCGASFTADIDRLLHANQQPPASHVGTLTTLANRFERDHATLAAAIPQVADARSRVGLRPQRRIVR